MDLGETERVVDDGNGGGGGVGGELTMGGSSASSASSISCSICLEAVMDTGERSWAKLQCGHEFHLDCIGSAFNAKGVMQCPNCRKIEKGRWIYGNGPRSHAEFSMDEWVPDEDLYDPSYSEVPFGVHWCPFSGLPRISAPFEEGEPPSTAYHDLLGGHHAIFAEHSPAPSAAHSCPYIAYFQLQPSSSNSTESISDGPFAHPWSGLSGPSEISSSHTFTTVDLHYHSWDHHPPSFSNGADQASAPAATLRPISGDSDGISRSGSFMHPFLFSPGSGPRAGNSFVSSMVPPIPSSISRGHDRVQGLHGYHQRQQLNSTGMRSHMFSGIRRSGAPRGMTPVGPVASSSENASGFVVFPPSGSTGQNLQEPENSLRNRFYAWERDRFAPFPLIPVDRDSSWWAPFHQSAAGGSESNSRNSSYWHRHGSERTASQNRSESSSYQQHMNPSGRLHRFI